MEVKVLEIVEALERMCFQYLSGPDWKHMRHDFMIAGETALDVLIDLGICAKEQGGATWADPRPSDAEILARISNAGLMQQNRSTSESADAQAS